MTKSAQPAIVLALNDDPDESSALRFAAVEAMRTGYPLRVVHLVHGTTRDPAHRLAYSVSGVDEAGRHLVERAEGRLQAVTHGSVPVVGDVFRGRAVVDKLVALSAEAHLLVLQRHDGARHTLPLSSSTTASVAGRAFAPVVSVPPGWDPEDAGFEGVTLAVGVYARPTQLMQRALDTAHENQLPLTVLHALDYPAAEGTESAREQERRLAIARAGLQRSLSWLRRHYPDVAVSTEVVLGAPETALPGAVGPRQLLVVGRRDAPFPAYEHVGDVTRHLLRTATVPVVVVPRPSDPARPHPRPRSREHHVG